MAGQCFTPPSRCGSSNTSAGVGRPCRSCAPPSAAPSGRRPSMFGSEPSGPSGPSGPPFRVPSQTAQPPRVKAIVPMSPAYAGGGGIVGGGTQHVRQGHVGGRCVPHWKAPAPCGCRRTPCLTTAGRRWRRSTGPAGRGTRPGIRWPSAWQSAWRLPTAAARRSADEPGLESAAEHVETAPGQFAVLAAVPHVRRPGGP